MPSETVLNLNWTQSARAFTDRMNDPGSGGFRSVPDGPVTLYGTCYGLLTRHYLGADTPIPGPTRTFLQASQNPESGLMAGPELCNWSPPASALHDREHLLLHLTCAALPVFQQFGLPVLHKLTAARCFCHADSLRTWLDRRDLKAAWLEGNNLLFAGQLLIYLRDVEQLPEAREALEVWFNWLARHVDPHTGLWGLAEGASRLDAMCGGYHQLLVYYHEQRPILYPQRLVDTVLSLQHPDGGFAPDGGGGACEDVDAVDILVNLYKQMEYRRPEIRWALRRCLRLLLALQNPDGGFPYSRYRPNDPISHMGIPGTHTQRGTSAMFPTWFRVHTLALIAQVLTDEPTLHQPLRFTRTLSMGWHRPWDTANRRLDLADRQAETSAGRQQRVQLAIAYGKHALRRCRRAIGRVVRRLLRRTS
jgi:hypothetical protein